LDRVYFYNDVEKLESLPAAWTDVVSLDPVVAVSAGRSAFRLDDLLTLTELIRTLRAKGSDK